MNKAIGLAVALALACTTLAHAATGIVTGTVRDAQDGLPSASIVLEGTRIGTTSDLDGSFRLPGVPEGTQTLVVTYVGYGERKVQVEIEPNQVHAVGSIVLEASSIELDKILVQSTYRLGEAKARAIEKNSLAIKNVLAADAIGKLPDRNAAEAIQRMPGVQLERDQGEGRYITVRGAPGQWSSTLLNGSRIPDARSGRRDLALDIFPAEFIEYVEVTKAHTPDQEGDTIGGSVDFLTRTAPEKRTLSVTLAGGMHNQSKRDMYIGSFFYGDRSRDGRFGAVVSAVVNNRDWGSDNYEVNYNDTEGSVNTLQLRDYLGNRTTYGLNLGSEYKVSDRTRVTLTGLYGRFHDDEIRRRERYQIDSKRYEMGLTATNYRSELWGGTFGIESNVSDRMEVKAGFGTNRSWYGYGGPETLNENQYGYYAAYFRQTGVEYLGLDSSGRKYLGDDSPDSNYQGDYYENIQPHVSPDTPIDPSRIQFYNASSSYYETTGRDYTAHTDLTYKWRETTTLKFGAKYRHLNAAIDRAYYIWTYDKPAYLADFQRDSFPENGGFLTEIGSPYDGVYQDFLTIDEAINVMNRTEFDPVLTVQTKDNSSRATSVIDVTEHHFAGYLMGEIATTPAFKLIPGARIEYTDASADSYAWLDDLGKAVPTNGSSSYVSVLPMVNAIYSPDDRYSVRAAGSRTFTRPNFYDIAPSQTVDVGEATVSRGNPDLKPTYAWNLDFLVSVYPTRLSAVSGGLFYKSIRDVITTQRTQETLTYEGVTQLFSIAQPVNADEAKLWGYEVGYSQSLNFLPGVLNGFGWNVNYTYTKSETDVPDLAGATRPLSNQSPHTYNSQLYYEKSGLSLRLAINYRAAFIDEYQSEADGERWRDKATQVDFSASYAVSPQMRLFVDLVNLNNAPLRSYFGRNRSDRPEQVEWYSMRGHAGISYTIF